MSGSPSPCPDSVGGGGGYRRRRRRRRAHLREGPRRRGDDGPWDYSCSPSYDSARGGRRGVTSGVNAIPLGNRGPDEKGGGPEEQETTTRVWVADRDCAKIIGRGGRTMREVEAKSRTKLKVQREEEMDKDSKERHVDIHGTTAETKAAMSFLIELATFFKDSEGNILKDTRPREDADGKPEDAMVIEVLPEEVGRILGRKGETVKLLEKETGSKIEVDKNTGRLEIYGNKEVQEKALEQVLGSVSFAKKLDGEVLKDTPRARPRDAEQAAEEGPPKKLWVRDREAGKVIGRGGETVRDVMEKTGADIKVQKSEEMKPGSGLRQILIYGQKEQQDQALELILGEVSWAKGEDAMLKGPPQDPVQEEQRAAERKRKREQRGRKRREREAAKEEEDRRRGGGRSGGQRAPNAGSGAWVCGSCGGDHRTKECPHANNIMGVGMQIGMQMGMQAMGMQHMGMMPMMPMMGMMGPGGPMGMSRTLSSGSSSTGSGSSDDCSSLDSEGEEGRAAAVAAAPGSGAIVSSADGAATVLAAGRGAYVDRSRSPGRRRRRRRHGAAYADGGRGDDFGDEPRGSRGGGGYDERGRRRRRRSPCLVERVSDPPPPPMKKRNVDVSDL